MGKKIVCYCQDITEEDIVRAIREGFDNLEMLKRYTGVFMGPCQGKMCAMNVLKIFSKYTSESIKNLAMPTLRPPVEPILLGSLVSNKK